MKLVRNTPGSDTGKYILIRKDKFSEPPETVEELIEAIKTHPDSVEFGRVGDPNEFFVIKLKDENADAALIGYASAVADKDPEFASDVAELALRSGKYHPCCKTPD
jgi:hypothetical protein